MEEKYLICEDSIEGIFTGIYEAYALKEDPARLHLQIGEEENLRLFASYVRIAPDAEKTAKVARTIGRRLGADIYMDICRAIASTDPEKGEAVYKTVVCGLKAKRGERVMENLPDPYVYKVFELARNTGNEVHHWKEFLRFQELETGILFSRIGPKSNVLTFLMPHFADRLPQLNFIIYDETRGIFAVHPASKDWYIVTGRQLEEEAMGRYSHEELEYQELFTYFCHKIAIKERENPKLQRNMLPLWFQDYMVEFWE